MNPLYRISILISFVVLFSFSGKSQIIQSCYLGNKALAIAYFQKGDYEQSKIYYLRALACKDLPKHHVVNKNLPTVKKCLRLKHKGDSLMARTNYVEARIYYHKILMLNPLDKINKESKIACEDSVLNSYKIQANKHHKNEMILVKGGTFKMGSEDGAYDEKPVHQVTVKNFYISQYEVSNAEFVEFLNAKGNRFEGGKKWVNLEGSYKDEKCRLYKVGEKFEVELGYKNYPVVYISWYAAAAYAKWKKLRLPTEAEWEYAARGGNKSKNYLYAGSNEIAQVAWYDNTAMGRGSLPCGLKQANELGLYDMSGNIWEWCSDWYKPYNLKANGYPLGVDATSHKILRGGAWYRISSLCRNTYRFVHPPHARYSDVGFRVAKSAN